MDVLLTSRRLASSPADQTDYRMEHGWFNFAIATTSGGMPLSALVTAATVRVAIAEGFFSSVSAVLAMVMYDAAGVSIRGRAGRDLNRSGGTKT